MLLLPDAQEATAEVNAPTTSTTLQLALGDALAVALLERRGFTAGDFRVFHPGGKLGAMLRTVGDLMHGPAELPLAAADTPMKDALLVMTEKRWGIIGVTGADGRLTGAITLVSVGSNGQAAGIGGYTSPMAPVISPDGRYAYVTNFGVGIGPGNVAVIERFRIVS